MDVQWEEPACSNRSESLGKFGLCVLSGATGLDGTHDTLLLQANKRTDSMQGRGLKIDGESSSAGFGQ